MPGSKNSKSRREEGLVDLLHGEQTRRLPVMQVL